MKVSRPNKEKEGFWSPFKEDVERIIHSKAFRRYGDKTQVVYLVENDHLTYRSLHVQLVSSYARGLGSKLNLDLDLIEAIALGHDVGHAPFGHEGEEYLSELTQELGLGAFCHAHQSCRLFLEIEPLNLTFATYDGFLCHDGGMKDVKIVPNSKKTWDTFYKECEGRRKNPEKNFAPLTIEGALVKIADTVSYIGKDIEDAVALGIVKAKSIPRTILGNSNREILENVGKDIISNSLNKGFIHISEDVFHALKELREFNFEHIYVNPKLKVESQKIRSSYRYLFDYLYKDYKSKKEKSHLFFHFLHSKNLEYTKKTSLEQKIVDYIAGMTDNYFVTTLEKLIIPQPIFL